MGRGARRRPKVAQNTSERTGMRPLGLRQQLLASFVACSPSRDRSSWRYRGQMGGREGEGEGEEWEGEKLPSVETVTIGSERIVWRDSWGN